MQDVVATIFVGGLVVGLVGLTGCSESHQRQAGQKLREAVDRAQKQHDKALTLLSETTYKVDQEYSPRTLTEAEMDSAELEIYSPGQIHPDVFPTLRQSEEDLFASLRENADAGAIDKALVQAALAEVLRLRGYCYGTLTSQTIQRLQELRGQAQQIANSAALQKDLLSYYQLLTAMGQEEIRQFRDQASMTHQKTITKLQEIQSKLQALQAEKDALIQTYEKLVTEARSLVIEGKLASGQEGLRKLENALGVQAKADASELRITEIEFESERLMAIQNALELDLATNKARMDVADELLQQRRDQADQTHDALRNVQEKLAQQQQALLSKLVEMARDCQETADNRTYAVNDYELALQQVQLAARALSAGGPDAATHQGDLLMTLAELDVLCLEVHQANTHFVERLKQQLPNLTETLEAAEAMETIQTFLTEPDALYQKAAERYSDAAESYRNVLRQADRQLRWAIEGQIGAAYARLYALTKDPEALKNASEALADALEGKRLAPHLKSVATLEKILQNSTK